MPGYHPAGVADALGVIPWVGALNLGLQFDVYHAQITGDDLTWRTEAAMSRLAHVQIAGVPEHNEPDREWARLACQSREKSRER